MSGVMSCVIVVEQKVSSGESRGGVILVVT